jgi:p-cumate 2,3-dioxygenase alpha subunit
MIDSSSLASRTKASLDIDEAAGIFRVARSNYVDPEIFRAEMENIFSKCWLYVGHESELKSNDSFEARRVGGRPVIFLRDKQGQIRCFLNVCPHRGAQITRHRSGRARNFSCIYHGWTFENTGKVRLVTEADT